MHRSAFFRIFPPPKYLEMRYSGLDVSDDAIKAIEYTETPHGPVISKSASLDMPPGVVIEGDIKDEKKLRELLSGFDREHDLSYVKVSIPEEKAYLFQTDVIGGDIHAIGQNIESKLEENVPLSAPDAVFYFDLMPLSVTGGVLRASVSVVPRTYVEHTIEILRASGISPVAFEVVPKSIARAIVPAHSEQAVMIVYVMRQKTGIYIVSGGVVCFTSTSGWGSAQEGGIDKGISALESEINKTFAYWMSHASSHMPIKDVILVGRDAPAYEEKLQSALRASGLAVSVGNAWQNVFDLDAYVPPISQADSLDYVVAAGLAMDA